MKTAEEYASDNSKQPIISGHIKFEQAHNRIKPYITKTQCRRSALLSNESGSDVFFKLENEQISGSFKIRGVINKILSLKKSDLNKTLIAASTGNHGAAFAHAIAKFNLDGKLFLPENITSIKLEGIKSYGIPLVFSGTDCVETELAAAAQAEKERGIFIGPYNDIDIILGQGTIGIELIEQLKQVDIVFIPVGGGGLISGIAAYLKNISPNTQIIGCQPLNSPVMYESVRAGKIIQAKSFPTLADATAGGIEPGSITFGFCKKLVNDFVLLSEVEILSAIKHLYFKEKIIAEGGSAMTVAALRKSRNLVKNKRVALIISGSKLDPAIIKELGEKNG